MTELLDACGDPPPAAAMERAVAALRAGGVLIIPTDTVYGVAVDPRVPGATEALFALKGRPPEVALPILVASVEQALMLAADAVPESSRRLMQRWWPGGLTVVVARREGMGLELGGPDQATVGLRLPAHPVPVALARAVGPLAVTSANRHGRATPVTAAEVLDQLGPGVAVALDGGPCRGAASTVVSCADDETLRVLREGVVPAALILTSP